MEKTFLDELMEELKALKEQEMENFYDKLDEGQLPKLPMTPLTVTKKFYEVALRHKMTKEELSTLLTFTEPSLEEIKNLQQMEKTE